MEPTSIVPTLVDAPARLSSAQRRDLCGQALAAVITTALIAAPFMAAPSDSAADATLPAQPFANVVSVVALANPETPLMVRGRARATARAPRSSGRLVATAISAVVPPPLAVSTPGYARAPLLASATARRPLSRKLTGWLTGDGTHTVRPFPTLASARP